MEWLIMDMDRLVLSVLYCTGRSCNAMQINFLPFLNRIAWADGADCSC